MTHESQDERFRRLFDEQFEDVRAYCLRRLPPDEASEAVSEVFLVAWRRFSELPEGGAARLWLYGVARNVVRNVRRSSRRQLRLTARLGAMAARPVQDDPQTQAVDASDQREILGALSRLNPIDQEVLQLRLWEDLSLAEVATVLDCGRKAASKRYQRAVNRLAKELGEETKHRMRPHLAETKEVSSE